MTLQVQLHHCWNSLRPFEDSWRAWASHSFMSDIDWLQPWWEAFATSKQSVAAWGGEPARRLAVLTAHDPKGELLGIAPFYFAAGVAQRSLRILGDGNTASDYVGILAPDDNQTMVARCVARWIGSEECRRSFGRIDSVQFEGQAEKASWVAPFLATLQEQSWLTHRTEMDGVWVASLPDDWQAYLKSLCHSHRRKVKKVVKQRSEGQTRVVIAETPAEISARWGTFVELHQRRRQALGQPGCFADPRFERFLRNATERFARRNQAWLITAFVGDQPMSCGLLFHSGRRQSLFQCGVDMSLQQFEPGHAINAAAIETSMERGRTEFDFLRGDEPYKRLWRASRAPLFRYRAVSPHWQSRLQHSAWWAARGLKRAAQAVSATLQQTWNGYVSTSNRSHT